VLINKARIECQSYRLTVEDPPTTEYITRHIAQIQQKYTQSGGVRPFGISVLIIGWDYDVPRLFQTDPSGTYSEWKANATGRNSKTVREFLEKNYKEGEADHDTIKLTIKALLEVVEGSDIEIAVLKKGKSLEFLADKEVEEFVTAVEAEKKAEKDK